VVTDDCKIDLDQVHALVLYDARNPAFQAGGQADKQWELSVAACLLPGLLRRLSWQRLLTHVVGIPELGWLANGLQEKYAISPE
jgi:hypothetical protein